VILIVVRNLKLFKNLIKFSRVSSRVKWLNGEKTNASMTISVLVLRVLRKLYNLVAVKAPDHTLFKNTFDSKEIK
jgi:hypothetical protein